MKKYLSILIIFLSTENLFSCNFSSFNHKNLNDTCKIYLNISEWIKDSVSSSFSEKRITISSISEFKCKQLKKIYRVSRKIKHPYIVFFLPRMEENYIYVSVDLYYHSNTRLRMYFKLIKIQDDFKIINCKRWVQF